MQVFFYRFLNTVLMLVFFSSVSIANLSGSLSEEAIEERFNPMFGVNIKNLDNSIPVEKTSKKISPKKIYVKNCAMCHNSGLAGAPKRKDKAAWAPRIKQGIDTLLKHAITGINGMPARGNCLSCTDDELLETIKFMIKDVK
jgi:cytochrome c5